jgi:hypothetical protein
MKVKEILKFPCGYEHNIEVISFGFGRYSSHLEEDICPLHGKNCKKVFK